MEWGQEETEQTIRPRPPHHHIKANITHALALIPKTDSSNTKLASNLTDEVFEQRSSVGGRHVAIKMKIETKEKNAWAL